MSTKNQSSFLRTLAISVTAFGCAAGLLLSVSTIASQGRTTPRNASKSATRHRVNLRVTDSPEGSRVALTADQSLKNYEAYRRGDQFYVKIPLSELPHADAVRGRAFTEVKVERISNTTIVAFRLQPGATARVEQWGNRLEIVFTVSRARLTSPPATARAAARGGNRIPSAQSDAKRAMNRKMIGPKVANVAASRAAKANASDSRVANSRKPATHKSEQRLNSAVVPPAKARNASKTRNAVMTEESRRASVEEESSAPPTTESMTPELPTDSRESSQVSSETAAVTVPSNVASNSSWTNMKQRAGYLVRFAELNPVPAGIGAALLLLLVGLAVMQRRRARITPRATLLSESLEENPASAETHPAGAADVITTHATPNTPPEGNASQGEAIGEAIGKLVLDNTHRADIMGSRCPDDRKAIEASLIKVITAADCIDDDRERARQALEEYGFVAQHSATLLKGRDAWERSSAARALGMIGSKTSMPFLIEALNDDDSVVRNQAVASLASLKDPAAIGALLEASRKHPDVPAALLSDTLSACSVDSLGFLDLPSSEAALVIEAATPVNDQAQVVEKLRDNNTDDVLSGWLAPRDNSDEELSTTESAPEIYTQVVRPAHERPYLRVVA